MSRWNNRCECVGELELKSPPVIPAACENVYRLIMFKLKPVWTKGDSQRVELTIDPRPLSVRITGNGQDSSPENSSPALIPINDSLRIEVVSREGFFTVTPGKNNRTRSIRVKDRLVFDFWIVAKGDKDFHADSATLDLIPYTILCGDTSGSVEPREALPYSVTIKVTGDQWWDEVVKWLNDKLVALGALLAAIAAVIGYFKGWFGGLFKRKEKPEGGA